MKPVTGIYQQLVEQIHARIKRLGLPMWRCDDLSGVQDGYTAKMLHPETPSGRQARWETLQLLIDAVYPDGFSVTIRPRGRGTPKALQRTSNKQVDQRVKAVMMMTGRQGGLKSAERRRLLMSAADKSRQTEAARKARWARKKRIGPRTRHLEQEVEEGEPA